jgi:hypothetical protein
MCRSENRLSLPAATIYSRNRILLLAEGWHARRREEVATMINNTFGVGVAGAVLSAGTSHAAHTAAPAAAVKHRAAAATDVSVDRGHT